jgi:S-adenosylmethionine/arginine decarboxylase-like enzyme
MEEWGQHLYIDLGDCDPENVRSAELIKIFMERLVKEIGMKQFGEVIMERFALHDSKVAGYSAMVFLETSSITSHYAEESNSVYLDIFSCSKIDKRKAIKYCVDAFKAGYVRSKITKRLIPTKDNSKKILK